MSRIDWRTAGTRIRFQPKTDGRNPDWDWVGQRWKDEADYYADDMTTREICQWAICPTCDAPAGAPCTGLAFAVEYHTPRRRAAGENKLAAAGPRFNQKDDK